MIKRHVVYLAGSVVLLMGLAACGEPTTPSLGPDASSSPAAATEESPVGYPAPMPPTTEESPAGYPAPVVVPDGYPAPSPSS